MQHYLVTIRYYGSHMPKLLTNTDFLLICSTTGLFANKNIYVLIILTHLLHQVIYKEQASILLPGRKRKLLPDGDTILYWIDDDDDRCPETSRKTRSARCRNSPPPSTLLYSLHTCRVEHLSLMSDCGEIT